MAITDPQAIKFSNEQVRPLCELARSFNARIESMQIAWQGGISDLFPNDATVLDDGRQAEGVSVLTGSDINQAVSTLIAMLQASNAQIIEKPCVRTLIAS